MTIDRKDGVLVARLDARYDAFHEVETARFEEQLSGAVADEDRPRLVLDMARTEYISSATIETLFRVWRKMQQHGEAKMVLAATTPFCREIVTTARLNDLWPLYDDVDAAVAAVKS